MNYMDYNYLRITSSSRSSSASVMFKTRVTLTNNLGLLFGHKCCGRIKKGKANICHILMLEDTKTIYVDQGKKLPTLFHGQTHEAEIHTLHANLHSKMQF